MMMEFVCGIAGLSTCFCLVIIAVISILSFSDLWIFYTDHVVRGEDKCLIEILGQILNSYQCHKNVCAVLSFLFVGKIQKMLYTNNYDYG